MTDSEKLSQIVQNQEEMSRQLQELGKVILGSTRDGEFRPGMAQNQMAMIEDLYGDKKKDKQGVLSRLDKIDETLDKHHEEIEKNKGAYKRIIYYGCGVAGAVAVIFKVVEFIVPLLLNSHK